MPDDPAGRSGSRRQRGARRARRRQPALPASRLRDHACAARPSKRLIEVPHDWFHHSRGPVWGRVPVRPADNDLTRQHAGRPIGQTITLEGPRARQRRPRRPGHAGRDLADQRLGRLPRPRRSRASCRSTRTSPAPGARSPTPRAATTSARSSRPPTRASSAALFRPAHIHTSLFGPRLGEPPGHAVLLRGRPAARPRPDPAVDPGPPRRRAADRALQLGRHRGRRHRLRARLRLGHRPARARGDADGAAAE